MLHGSIIDMAIYILTLFAFSKDTRNCIVSDLKGTDGDGDRGSGRVPSHGKVSIAEGRTDQNAGKTLFLMKPTLTRPYAWNIDQWNEATHHAWSVDVRGDNFATCGTG